MYSHFVWTVFCIHCIACNLAVCVLQVCVGWMCVYKVSWDVGTRGRPVMFILVCDVNIATE